MLPFKVLKLKLTMFFLWKGRKYTQISNRGNTTIFHMRHREEMDGGGGANEECRKDGFGTEDFSYSAPLSQPAFSSDTFLQWLNLRWFLDQDFWMKGGP